MQHLLGWCTMKILVLSDSHAAHSFMRQCISSVKPDHVVHLGDHYEDGVVMAEENPHIRFHLVPGNCDRYRCDPTLPDILCYSVGGVRLYMTHGHKHGVKSDIGRLLADAHKANAAAALYGHTHQAQCFRDEGGMWVLNPGTCGTYGGSAGIIETDGEKITACRIIGQAELELFR